MNRVPGILYGPDPVSGQSGSKILLTVSSKDIMKEARIRGASLENKIFELVLPDETKHKVILRDFQVCSCKLFFVVSFVGHTNICDLYFSFRHGNASVD